MNASRVKFLEQAHLADYTSHSVRRQTVNIR
jgi:hypothetical protein